MSYHERHIQEARYNSFWQPVYEHRMQRLNRLIEINRQSFIDAVTKARLSLVPFDHKSIILTCLKAEPTLEGKCRILEHYADSLLA